MKANMRLFISDQ